MKSINWKSAVLLSITLCLFSCGGEKKQEPQYSTFSFAKNVLLESTGDVKIMDFGIARVADMKGMTSTGTIMGTPDYMSPEQAQGLPVDHRTDIYSTGVVLFEVFTGKLPFTADSALSVLNKHIREAVPRPTVLNPALPKELEQILIRALAKNPDQRYSKISQLYADLEAASAKISTPQEKIA